MKKILSALLLASMLVAALASCTTGDGDTTTTPAPATTTTTKKPVNTPPVTETTEPQPEAEVPKTPGAGLDELLAGKTKVEVDMTQLGVVDFDAWDDANNGENLDKLFDGIMTEQDWYYNEDGTIKEGASIENAQGGGPGKIGGDCRFGDDNGAWFYFALTEEAKLTAYVIWTGNDNSTYMDRNPVEWKLYGTNDAEAFAAGAAAGLANNTGENDTRVTLTDIPFDESKWTCLDDVYDGAVEQGNFLANGYEIDADKQQSFKYYCWYLGYTEGGSFQACELELFK